MTAEFYYDDHTFMCEALTLNVNREKNEYELLQDGGFQPFCCKFPKNLKSIYVGDVCLYERKENTND